MSQYQNRQEFDMKADEQELLCHDPNCIRIFAHKAHKNTNQQVVKRSEA
jgi:hypothetical protein